MGLYIFASEDSGANAMAKMHHLLYTIGFRFPHNTRF